MIDTRNSAGDFFGRRQRRSFEISLFVVSVHILLFQAGNGDVETKPYNHPQSPAGCPGPTDPGEPEKRSQHKDQHDPENKIGKGTYGKADISVAAADNGIRIDFDVDDQIERSDRRQIQNSRLQSKGGILFLRHEQADQRPRKQDKPEHKCRRKRRGNHQGSVKAALDSPELPRPVILRGIIGQSVCVHAQTGHPERDDFEARRKARGDAEPFLRRKFIDAHLNEEVPHRHEAVLQNDGQRQQDEHFEKSPGKGPDLFLGRNLQHSRPPEHKEKRKHASRALRDEGRPGHPRNAPGLHHEIVEHNIGHGRKHQK